MGPKGIFFSIRGYFRYRQLSGPPVIVGGCERSGTTLIQAILSAQPTIHSIQDETWAFCYSKWAGFGGDRPIRLRRLFRHLGEERMSQEARRWSEKSPANIFHFKEILEHFGRKVRLIQMVRDGRDVVSSIHPRNPQRPWVPKRRWIMAVTAGLEFRTHPQVMTIRYEDLVTDFDASTRALWEFLEEQPIIKRENWVSHARMTESVNVRGREIGEVHSNGVRKFETPSFPYQGLVDGLLSEPTAKSLLDAYGYL